MQIFVLMTAIFFGSIMFTVTWFSPRDVMKMFLVTGIEKVEKSVVYLIVLIAAAISGAILFSILYCITKTMKSRYYK